MHTRRLWFPLFAGATLCCASAQASEEAKNSDRTSQPEAQILPTITVTAPRPLALQSTRYSLNEIRASARDEHDASQLLSTIPGFSSMRKGGNNGEIVLRGVGGSRVGVLAQGQELLGSCYSRMDAPAAYLFPERYDKVTVIKGPQSVRYGSGYSAGVVAFEIEPPQFDAPTIQGSIRAGAGSFGAHEQLVDLSAGARAHYLRVLASRSESNDYKNGAGEKVHSSYEKWSSQIALGWRPDDNTWLELSTGLSDGAADYADRHSDAVRLRRYHWNVHAERININDLIKKFSLDLYDSRGNHVMDNYSRRSMHEDWQGVKMVMNPKNRVTGWRITGELTPSARTYFTLGTDGQVTDFFNRMAMYYPNLPPLDHLPPALRHPNSTDYKRYPLLKYNHSKRFGLFLEAQQRLDAQDNHRLVAGLRLDRQSSDYPNNKRSRRNDLYSAFVRYEFDGENRGGSIGLGHSQRMPDYWELMWTNDNAGGGSITSLRPEKLNQIDASYYQQFGAFRGTINAFYGKTDDHILFHWRPKMYVENIDATRFGAEVQLEWTLNEQTQAYTSLAWVRGFNDTRNTPLAQQPPLEWRLGVDHRWNNWTFNGEMRAVRAQKHFDFGAGGVDGYDKSASPGFATFDFSADWQVRRNLSLSFSVDNLFDRDYYEHLSTSSTNGSSAPLKETPEILYEPGRNLWARFRWEF